MDIIITLFMIMFSSIVFSSIDQVQISNATVPYLPYYFTVSEPFFNSPQKWYYLTVEHCDKKNKRQLFDEVFFNSEINLTLKNIDTTIFYYNNYLMTSEISSKATDVNLFISQLKESDKIVHNPIVPLDFNYNFNDYKWSPSYYREGNIVPSTTKNKTFYNIETQKLITKNGKCFTSSVDYCYECQKDFLLSKQYCSIDNNSTKWNLLITDVNKKISLASKNKNQHIFVEQGSIDEIPIESKFYNMTEPWKLNSNMVHYKFEINNIEEIRSSLLF